jgi:hypothetical protein
MKKGEISMKKFVLVFVVFVVFAAAGFAQEYSPLELKSVGMIPTNEAKSEFNIKVDIKNVNNKDIEISIVLVNKNNEELTSWKGFISPAMNEIIIRKAFSADIVANARYLDLKIANLKDYRGDYISDRFVIPASVNTNPNITPANPSGK